MLVLMVELPNKNQRDKVLSTQPTLMLVSEILQPQPVASCETQAKDISRLTSLVPTLQEAGRTTVDKVQTEVAMVAHRLVPLLDPG